MHRITTGPDSSFSLVCSTPRPQISRLYSQIISAEEANKAVEDSLSYIESQQGELGNLLDGYEAQANDMFDGAGGRGVGLDFGPADGEREKA